MKKLYLIIKALTAFVVILMGYMARLVNVECFVVECQIKFAVARGQIRYIQRFQVVFSRSFLFNRVNTVVNVQHDRLKFFVILIVLWDIQKKNFLHNK